jgi:neuronal calcium sensor 1
MGNCVGGKGSKSDPTKLTDEEIKILLSSTKLNKAQIYALHQNFLKECPSGKLTKKDFVKLFKEVHPSENKKEKADKFCEYVFKVIDNDNLGYISFKDFVLCFSLTSYGDFKEKCEFAFKLYDLDKDGKISKKEMTQVLEALYDLSGITDRKGDRAPAKKVDEIIKKLNQNQPPAATSEPAAAAAAPATTTTETPAEQPATETPTEAPAAPAAETEAPKDKKGAKPTKEKKQKPAPKPAKTKPAATEASKSTTKTTKSPEFITRDQFIEACNTDESIKKLFVDSIFASPSEFNIDEHVAEVTALADSTSTPNVVVETNTTVDSDHNKDIVTTTTTVDLNDATSTQVVNHSEVIISGSEDIVVKEDHSTNEAPAADPAPEVTSTESVPESAQEVVDQQVNSLVEEINKTIQAETTETTSNDETQTSETNAEVKKPDEEQK